MNDTSIILHNVTVTLQGTTVLDGISFELLPGQHLAITGASGSGKTTLAKALAGQVFYRGTITGATGALYVEPRHSFKSLANGSSFYYQQRYNSADADDAVTVEEELRRIAQAFYAAEEASRLIDKGLSRFGIFHRRHTPLLQLSNGEHKRLQLLKAVLRQPDVLILDQPFTGLDVAARRDLHTLINQLAEETRIILITGAQEIPACITHMAQLEDGRLKQFVPKESFHTVTGTVRFFEAATPLCNGNKPVSFATAVKMVNTSVRYGEKRVLSNINWQVTAGERWLVKGPNGSGKSTLLSLITADNPQAYANEIYLFDRRRGTGESIADIKRNIGFVSPELHWYFEKDTTVAQAVASGFFDTTGLYRRLDGAQQASLHDWLAFFRLTAVQDKLFSVLSAGQQRFVLLARALVKNPPLLVLDEPCQGLDPEQTADFRLLVDELCKDESRTLLYVSHYEEEVPSCVTHQLSLVNGVATVGALVRENQKAA